MAMALAAQLAFAQSTLYKSTMPDGRVIYGEKPAPDAKKVEAMKTDTSKKGVIPPSAKEVEAARQADFAKAKGEAQGTALQAAEDKVKQAEAALANGREPEPGERIGTAGGASRLNDSYYARQKKLEQAVEQAKADLEKMRSGR
jgi:hypothetical protein